MSPAMVLDERNETVEVVTTADLRDAQRFWIKAVGIPLIPFIGTLFVLGNSAGQRIRDNTLGHQQDSAAIVQLRVDVAQLRTDFMRDIDSSLALQQEILRAVKPKK